MTITFRVGFAALAASLAVSAEVRPAAAQDAKQRGIDLEDVKARLSINPASKMAVANFDWKLGGFGTVGIVNPTIRNDNAFKVKDIEIECTFSGKSGTRLSQNSRVIFDTIKANSRKTFKDFNIGQVHPQSAKAYCEVNSAKMANPTP